jgi:hypothetical protein
VFWMLVAVESESRHCMSIAALSPARTVRSPTPWRLGGLLAPEGDGIG